MIRLAVIGTNWITQRFIDAAVETGKFQLTAVYSRTLQRAQEFGELNGAELFFDSLEQLAQSDRVDAVYIASPNVCHYQQSMLMMQHDKHVICEKPLSSNLREAEEMVALARERKMVLFEAFKTACVPNYLSLLKMLPRVGKMRKVFFNYCQYSSRYQRYLDGENPNTFNPAFSNGSIMDIGYYCLNSALFLFGEPKSVQASATLLDSGVDAHGSVIMNYGEFDVVLFHSKVSQSDIPSEIQGEKGTLTVEKLSECEKIVFTPRGGVPMNITLPHHENTMFYEAEVFARMVQSRNYEHIGLGISLISAKLLTEIRAQTGVKFPADER